MGLAAGAPDRCGLLFIRALQLRQHDRTRDRTLPRFSRGGTRRRGASDAGGAPIGVLLESQCRDDPLRHGVSARVFWSWLRIARNLVEVWILDLGSRSRDLDGY